MSNISRLESVLWEVYGKVKVMAEKINTTTPFLSRIEKSSDHVWGKEIRVGELPLRSELKNLYTKMQFSDKALRSAHGNELVRLISDEAEAAIKEASFNLQRQLLGDSSGRIRSTAELYGGMRIGRSQNGHDYGVNGRKIRLPELFSQQPAADGYNRAHRRL
jgi:hypothetical protein